MSNLHQDVLAGKLACLPVAEELRIATIGFRTKQDIIQQLGRKDSYLSKLFRKAQDAFKHVEDLELEIGRAEGSSPSLEGKNSAKRTTKAQGTRALDQSTKPNDSLKPPETIKGGSLPDASKLDTGGRLNSMITRQQPPEDKEDQGATTSGEDDDEEIEITKVVKLTPSSEIRGRPGQFAEKSHQQTSGDNSGRHSLQGLRLPVGIRRAENGFGFEYDTPPTGPRAMIRNQDDVRAIDDRQGNNNNQNQNGGRKRRRHTDRASVRAEHGSPSPRQTPSRWSQAQRSYGSYRLNSFQTGDAGSRRGDFSIEAYGDPNRVIQKPTKWDPRSSGKR